MGAVLDDISPEEIKQLDARWKSDMDRRVDYLIRADAEFKEKYSAFLDMLILREGGRAELRKAIIEKSLSGLVVAALAGLFTILVEWTRNQR